MDEYLKNIGNPTNLFNSKLIATEDIPDLQTCLLDSARNGRLHSAAENFQWYYPVPSGAANRDILSDVLFSYNVSIRQFLLIFFPRLDQLPELLNQKKIYTSLLAHIEEAHLFCSMQGDILYSNKKALSVLGRDEIAADTPFEELIKLKPEHNDYSLAGELSTRGQSFCPGENLKGQELGCDFRLIYDNTGAPMGLTLYLENDIARLEAQRRALELEENLQEVLKNQKFDQDRVRIFQQIVESNREAMLFCDMEGQILYANRSAQKMYGYELEDLIRHNMGDFFERDSNTSRLIVAGLRDYGYYTGDILQFDKNGQELEILHSCNLVFNDEGVPIGILTSNRDVGPQRQAERESIRKTEELLEVRLKFVEELEIKVEERTRDLEVEREKSESLLRNILPESAARELKTTGQTTSRVYEQVTILFTDFKDFTSLTRDMDPEELIKELNYFFTRFDHIIAEYNLEKIKTIGDAYMCAGGLPEENTTNPIDATRAGLAIQDFIKSENEIRTNEGRPRWHLRLGIHTGRVVAGVVGVQKFAYDIWGDAVNVASRVETSGMIDRVNISGDTWELIKDDFECVERGAIEVKNRGSIPMYFVTGAK